MYSLVLTVDNYKLTLAIYFTKVKSCVTIPADPQHPLKEFRVGSNQEKTGRTGL